MGDLNYRVHGLSPDQTLSHIRESAVIEKRHQLFIMGKLRHHHHHDSTKEEEGDGGGSEVVGWVEERYNRLMAIGHHCLSKGSGGSGMNLGLASFKPLCASSLAGGRDTMVEEEEEDEEEEEEEDMMVVVDGGETSTDDNPHPPLPPSPQSLKGLWKSLKGILGGLSTVVEGQDMSEEGGEDGAQ